MIQAADLLVVTRDPFAHLGTIRQIAGHDHIGSVIMNQRDVGVFANDSPAGTLNRCRMRIAVADGEKEWFVTSLANELA